MGANEPKQTKLAKTYIKGWVINIRNHADQHVWPLTRRAKLQSNSAALLNPQYLLPVVEREIQDRGYQWMKFAREGVGRKKAKSDKDARDTRQGIPMDEICQRRGWQKKGQV